MIRWLLIGCFFVSPRAHGQFQLVADGGISSCHIMLPARASRVETKAAAVLQDYIMRATGARLPVETETSKETNGFFIGDTREAAAALNRSIPADGFRIREMGKNILIDGNGRGTLYGVYRFIERWLGARKWDAGPAFVPKRKNWALPAQIDEQEQPAFAYRESYFPYSADQEYLDWYGLQRFEDLWGLWGHSFFKLVPPRTWFAVHPEYFSLVDGRRQPLQLCLSNPDVLKITITWLKDAIQKNPDAKYWSVAQNDDIGHCECDQCRKLDATDGGPQGSLLYFVNKVAAAFPEKTITTLAYEYTASAPAVTRPAANVVILLSSIDALRSAPLAAESSAAAFRHHLDQWKERTPHIFAWDYCTQFTNYLTPFPVEQQFRPNLQLFAARGVSGVLEQGSGDTYSDMAELNSYLLARLLWNPSLNADSLENDFVSQYYGKAAPFVQEYLHALRSAVAGTHTSLDIYGNPVNDHNGYLSPERINAYSGLMDRAETAVQHDPLVLQRLRRIRLSQEFVVLQQSRFYGTEQHGIFERHADGTYQVKARWPARVSRFVQDCKDAGVHWLAEDAIAPAAYEQEWQRIFRAGVRNNLAVGAAVSLQYPFVPEYPAKKEATLADQTPGYEDFSYNWLCFYGVPMVATIDLHTVQPVSSVSLRFLEDARHWIFGPASVQAEVSMDGIHYTSLEILPGKHLEEDFSVRDAGFTFHPHQSIRYLRVTAIPISVLPSWRYSKTKKPMLACDEVWVE